VASLLENRDADRNHCNRGFCLVVTAADRLPDTTSFLLVQILLPASEGGIWPSRLRQGANLAPGPLAPSAREILEMLANGISDLKLAELDDADLGDPDRQSKIPPAAKDAKSRKAAAVPKPAR